MTRLLPLFLLLGCQDARQGTSVGNPTKTTLTVAEARQATVLEAQARVEAVALHPCGATDLGAVWVDRALDLLEPDEIRLPAGHWCAIEVVFLPEEVPVFVEGTTASGGTFALELGLGGLFLSAEPNGFDADRGDWVLELGEPGWIDGDVLGPGDTVIGPFDPDYEALLDVVHTTTAFWADPDGDGILTEAERIDGPVAGEMRPEEEPEVDNRSVSGENPCGCAQTGGSAGWLALPLALALRRRRSRPAPSPE